MRALEVIAYTDGRRRLFVCSFFFEFGICAYLPEKLPRKCSLVSLSPCSGVEILLKMGRIPGEEQPRVCFHSILLRLNTYVAVGTRKQPN